MSTLEPGVTGRRPRVKSHHRSRQKKAQAAEEITLSVPEAGKRFFGLSRNGSYAAADRGDIPTVRIGKLRRVPLKVLERRLEALAR